MGVKSKTVKEALEYVARHPVPDETPPLVMPIWELVARQLYEKSYAVGGTKLVQKEAVLAQRIILERTVGKRRTGSHPAVAVNRTVKIADFTQKKEIEP